MKFKNNNDDRVDIYVINSNTGHIVRSELVYVKENLLSTIKKYSTKNAIIIASTDRVYCIYIKEEMHILIKSDFNMMLFIDLFNDVIFGLYDNARDAYHVQYGFVIASLQDIDSAYNIDFDVLFKCVDSIWETRYYSRYYRRVNE